MDYGNLFHAVVRAGLSVRLHWECLDLKKLDLGKLHSPIGELNFCGTVWLSTCSHIAITSLCTDLLSFLSSLPLLSIWVAVVYLVDHTHACFSTVVSIIYAVYRLMRDAHTLGLQDAAVEINEVLHSLIPAPPAPLRGRAYPAKRRTLRKFEYAHKNFSTYFILVWWSIPVLTGMLHTECVVFCLDAPPSHAGCFVEDWVGTLCNISPKYLWLWAGALLDNRAQSTYINFVLMGLLFLKLDTL